MISEITSWTTLIMWARVGIQITTGVLMTLLWNMMRCWVNLLRYSHSRVVDVSRLPVRMTSELVVADDARVVLHLGRPLSVSVLRCVSGMSWNHIDTGKEMSVPLRWQNRARMAMNCACYLTCRGLVRARSVTCVVVEFGLKLLVLATLPRVKG